MIESVNFSFKGALIIFETMDKITIYNGKGIVHSDKLTNNYHPALQFSSVQWSVLVLQLLVLVLQPATLLL